jgi:pSer/pThr/pTyr-binding forkhead associated (FHA) protein
MDGKEDIPLDRGVLVVGRDARCDAQIDSRKVSRLHCCVSRHRDEIAVRDLGSINGTWINGQRADSGRLRHGDELSIARFRYRLEVGRARATSTAPNVPSGGPLLASGQGGDTPFLKEIRAAHRRR